jgi:hypothetical protein
MRPTYYCCLLQLLGRRACSSHVKRVWEAAHAGTGSPHVRSIRSGGAGDPHVRARSGAEAGGSRVRAEGATGTTRVQKTKVAQKTERRAT